MANTKDKQELVDSSAEKAKEKIASCTRSESLLYQEESKWFERLERNIVLHLEDHLITNNVKLIYPEV